MQTFRVFNFFLYIEWLTFRDLLSRVVCDYAIYSSHSFQLPFSLRPFNPPPAKYPFAESIQCPLGHMYSPSFLALDLKLCDLELVFTIRLH